MNKSCLIGLCLGSLFQPVFAQAAVITFSDVDFGKTPIFNNVQAFSFTIDISGPLTAGLSYNNPSLNSVEYSVSGSLLPDGSPSGFPRFNLERNISGPDFYAQGSSLNFEIAASADLSNGLQVSELVGSFVFNGREVDTGRYHPALFELNSDGTGSIQNSNNMGENTPNPSTGELVNVEFGEEYITNLTFDPNQLTISAAVPVPAALWLFGSGLLGLVGMARRKKA